MNVLGSLNLQELSILATIPDELNRNQFKCDPYIDKNSFLEPEKRQNKKIEVSGIISITNSVTS